MHDVFISFSSRDRTVAERIYDRLERRGVRPWMSSRDIPPGADYQGCIVEALTASNVVLLVFSSHANASTEILKELALAGQKLVIPARIEDVAPQGAFLYQFSNRQFFDMFNDFDVRLDQLCDWVKRVVDSQSQGAAATAAVLADGQAPEMSQQASTTPAPAEVPAASFSNPDVAAPADAPASAGGHGGWKLVAAAVAVIALAIGVSSYMKRRHAQTAPAATTATSVTPTTVPVAGTGADMIPERDPAAPAVTAPPPSGTPAPTAPTEAVPPPADAGTDEAPKEIRERGPDA